jgi:signal transduction histidine kinase
MVSHDLRTPLSAIIASSEILKLKLYDTTEQLDEFTLMIHDQGNQMLNLVNDILDFVKIQSGKMDYFIESAEIREVIEHELCALKSVADISNISVELLPFKSGGVCYFDKVRIKQVFNNLLSNAIKYNRPNGAVRLIVDETDSHVNLTFEDTGHGIENENLGKIFNEFETLGKIAHHAKGTGLGLPITKRMIEAMGGEIFVTSKIGVGSQFKIAIPKNKVLPEELYRSRPEESESGDLAA